MKFEDFQTLIEQIADLHSAKIINNKEVKILFTIKEPYGNRTIRNEIRINSKENFIEHCEYLYRSYIRNRPIISIMFVTYGYEEPIELLWDEEIGIVTDSNVVFI